jgi:uncharacterized protein (TIGR02001 family)
MKRILTSFWVATLLAAPAALLAQTAAPAAEPAKPEPDFTFTGNMALSSEYLYRGIAQSNHQPAISGGFDFAHKSGFYLGNWNSSISWISDAVQAAGITQGTSAPVEMDFYGGYKFSPGADITLDVGALYYYYPIKGFKPDPSVDTLEVYLAGTWGPATLKYSQSTTELFGFIDSKNSSYIELAATFDVGGGFAIAPHVGYQKVKGLSDCDYTDYNVKATKDLSGWTLTLGAYGTNAKDICYMPGAGPASGKNLGASRVVASFGKSF